MANFIAILVFISTSVAFAQADLTETDHRIRRIIEASERAQNHEDWHNIDRTLRAERSGLFNNVETDFYEVCASLEKLEPQELLHFYDEFTKIRPRLPESCRREALERIEAYMYQKAGRLYNFRKKLTPCRADTRRKPQQVLGPTLRYEYDNAMGKTVTNAGLPECYVNLTFDDGPHGTLTERLLATLNIHNVKANFFVLGRQVQTYQLIAKAIADDGHIIGNHTFSHKNLPNLNPAAAENEITSGFRILLDLFGEFTPFFRFPYGASTKHLKAFAYQRRWLDFFWTMDTLDWKIKDPEKLYVNVLQEIERERRGVMLFHDIHPQTITVMPFLLQELNDAGYTTVLITPREMQKSVAY